MSDSRQRLVDAVRANDAQIAQLEREHERMVDAAQSSNADDEHDPEGATIAYEREQLTAVLNQARQVRADLQQALTDLDEGRYGICEHCGRPIGAERLEARPRARQCIDCARSS